jgi:hypothetical protein
MAVAEAVAEVGGLEVARELPERFCRAEEERAARSEGARNGCGHAPLSLGTEVDQDVAQEDHVERRGLHR